MAMKILWIAVFIIETVAIVTINAITIVTFVQAINLRKRKYSLLINLHP